MGLPSGPSPCVVQRALRAARCRCATRVVRVALDHAAVFQRRGGAEDALGLGGVLHARQLDHDAVGALALDHRLGDAERVDAVAQGADVLLDRVGRDPAGSRHAGTRHDDRVAGAVAGAGRTGSWRSVACARRRGRHSARACTTMRVVRRGVRPTRSGCGFRAAARADRRRRRRTACQAPPSGRPASGSARRPAGRGRAASAARRSRAARPARSRRGSAQRRSCCRARSRSDVGCLDLRVGRLQAHQQVTAGLRSRPSWA